MWKKDLTHSIWFQRLEMRPRRSRFLFCNENDFLTISTDTKETCIPFLKGDNDLPTLGNDMAEAAWPSVIEVAGGIFPFGEGFARVAIAGPSPF